MAYSVVNSKGVTYYLNAKEVTLKNGQSSRIHFFTKDARPATGLEALPVGYQVSESKNGLLVLKKV